ncbi:MAG: ATP-dependent helicase HrpB [Lysobacterales bacterium]|nr:MAG: ATP-dependent helicase HrpB [Xanthomonadales bacterium]
MNEALPIEPILPALAEALARNQRVLLEAPPGSGKTTRVPPRLLAAPWLAGQNILMLEPRRLAARAAAERMAAERGEAVGSTIGYRVRFEARVSARTRIEVLTEALLTRRIQDDPTLSGVGLLIFDEFHERHLHSDLGLALALEVQESLRPDLRILIMSATLGGERLERLLKASRVSGGQSPHPLTIRWAPPPRGDWLRALPQAVEEALSAGGDVLVFLPGRREIEAAGRLLSQRLPRPGVSCLSLHGELSLAEQARVLARSGDARRVILATNIAESSLTVPGVRAVVDTGLAREPRFDPASGLSRLVTVRISEASAAQRAGRAAREGPGLAIRLWSREERLEPEIRPEILHAELSALALELAAWGDERLPFLDPPPRAHLQAARELLLALGALGDDGRITGRGKAMLATGLPPRLAAIALAAQSPAQKALAAKLIALLEGPDPLTGERRRDPDLRLRIEALDHSARDAGDVHPGRLALLRQSLAQWRQRLGAEGDAPDHEDAAALLAAGFLDRIARADRERPERYQLASGLRAEIPRECRLYGHRWLLALALEGEAGQARIRLALPLAEEEALAFAQALLREEIRCGCREGRLSGERLRSLGALLLERHSLPVGPSREGALALLSWVRSEGLRALPLSERARSLIARSRLLARRRPELAALPDEQALLARADEWLLPLLHEVTSLAELDPGRLEAALLAAMPHSARSELDRLLPERIRLPSGRFATVRYPEEQEPYLAVRIQELFGLSETPRILDGAQPLALHLLSPAGRPLQITRDLGGFWREHYPALRRQLKARYPKHAWPEDPLAPPTGSAKSHRPG